MEKKSIISWDVLSRAVPLCNLTNERYFGVTLQKSCIKYATLIFQCLLTLLPNSKPHCGSRSANSYCNYVLVSRYVWQL